jgi:hypothetical protein
VLSLGELPEIFCPKKGSVPVSPAENLFRKQNAGTISCSGFVVPTLSTASVKELFIVGLCRRQTDEAKLACILTRFLAWRAGWKRCPTLPPE